MQNKTSFLQPKSVKIAIAVFVVIFLYTILGFFVLPMIVQSILPDKLASAINRQVSLEKVEINPYSLTLTLKGLAVTDPDNQTFLSLDEFFVNLQMVSLLKKALILKNVRIAKPFLRIAHHADGSFNFSDLLAAQTPETPPETEAKDPPIPNFAIQNLQVKAGRIAYVDRYTAVPFETALESLDITLRSVSSQPDSKAVYTFATSTPAKEILNGQGSFSLFPLASEGTLALKNILLKKYAPFYQHFIDFEIVDGRLDIQTGYRFKFSDQPEVLTLSQASIALNSLRSQTKEDREKLIAVDSLVVTDAAADILKQEITIGSLSGSNGYLLCKRFADGSLSLDRLIAAKAMKTHAASSPPSAAPAPQPWHVSLKSIMLEDNMLQVQDRTTADPVNILLDHIKVEAKDLTTKPNGQGRVSIALRWNQKGSVSVQGSVAADPVSADLTVNAGGLDIRSLQPYLADKVKLIVTDGNINAKGRIHFAQPKGGTPDATFQGEASVTDFASVDQKETQDFLKWKSLHLGGVNIGYQPLRLRIDEVALSDFYSRLIINPDGTINVRTIFSPPDETAAKAPAVTATETAEAPATLLPEIAINTVVLQGGTVSFADQLTQPHFETNLTELGGRISGLSSAAESRADVLLEGSHGGSSPLEIKGKINPLIANRIADLTLTFRNIELSPFSPYSGKYLGYILAKGQLTLELGYKLIDNRIQGKNRIFLDQLTLGDKVDSLDATSLPIKLGLALLKDRNGQIELDLPVNGDLNDPQFNIGKIVIKMIGNLFAKIISSPFSALSSMFGDGVELSYMDFEPGSAQINVSRQEQLNILITALYDRPALQLEIQGAVDPEKDRQALRQIEFDNLIKSQILKDRVKKDQDTVPLDQIKIEPETYPTYLTKAYKASAIPKPRDVLGRIKKLPVAEMEKLLYTGIDITDEDLRLLAHERANKVENYIVASERIDPRRVFIVEPASLADQQDKDKHQSRVNFSLK